MGQEFLYKLQTKKGTLYDDYKEYQTALTASRLLKSLYRPNFIYRSTGVTLKKLTYGQMQQSLFEEIKPHDDKLSHLVDEIDYYVIRHTPIWWMPLK